MPGSRPAAIRALISYVGASRLKPAHRGDASLMMPYGLIDAQAQRFGVDDADVEALGCGVGSDVAHAEHWQREVVGPGPETVVTKRRVDEQGVEWLREVRARDGTVRRYLHAGSPKRE